MTDEHLDKLWARLSSATNIKNLDYPESVTIGHVFGQLRSEIKKQREAIKLILTLTPEAYKEFEKNGIDSLK